MIDKELINNLFHYCSNTGILSWKVKRGSAQVGSIAGCVRDNGYLDVRINKKLYRVHRIIWIMMYGYMPTKDIDHLNGERADNRLCNLREVSRGDNMHNLRGATKRNKTGLLGVSRHKFRKTWRARLCVDGNQIYLGVFETPNEAYIAYMNAKRKYTKIPALGGKAVI